MLLVSALTWALALGVSPPPATPVAFSTIALASATMQWQWMSMVRHGLALPARGGALPWSVAGQHTLHWNSMKDSLPKTGGKDRLRRCHFCSASVEVAGPSPMISSTASSSLAPSQCTCLALCVTKLPAGIGVVFAGSNLGPDPTHQVPCSATM